MKITEKHLQSLIARVEYHRVPDSTVTLASLILHNGFAVNGESACINPADFDEKIGQEIAYKNAFEQLWKLEGYRIKAETEPLEQTWQGRLLLEYRQLQKRTEKLYQFLSANPDHEAVEILSAQYHPMREYLSVLQDRVGALDKPVMQLPPLFEAPFEDLSEEDRKCLQERIEKEGFDYAFKYYSLFAFVQNAEFHRRREAYLAAREHLAELIRGKDE